MKKIAQILTVVASCLLVPATSLAATAASNGGTPAATGGPATAKTPSAATKLNASPAEKCNNTAAVLNSRSKRLSDYKKSEDSHYKKLRDNWSGRIAYASMWTPDSAKKSRDDLYKYDRLVKAFDKELDKQIKDFKYLEKTPTDCTTAHRTELKKLIGDARSGHATLEKNRTAVVAFLRGDFKDDMKSMITKLHIEKKKDAKSKYGPIIVSGGGII
jgi:hypothetical protein